MTKHVYEISVHGDIRPGLLAELGSTRYAPAPAETVITTRLCPEQLERLVAWMADLGLDVLAFRRLPGSFATSPA